MSKRGMEAEMQTTLERITRRELGGRRQPEVISRLLPVCEGKRGLERQRKQRACTSGKS